MNRAKFNAKCKAIREKHLKKIDAEHAKRVAKLAAKQTEQSNSVSQCRDCKLTTTEISRYEYFKSSRPRCNACGGTMEYLPFIEGTTRDAPSRKQA